MTKVLKSQVKSGLGQLIENQSPALPCPPFGAAPLRPARPAATPPGGAPREDCLPLAVRPVHLSGVRHHGA